MSGIKHSIFIGVILIMWICSIVLANVLANDNQRYTELKIFNPYSSISLKIMVKCDHNHKTKKYNFYKIVIIKAPVGLKKCEIWPIDMKMFGDL